MKRLELFARFSLAKIVLLMLIYSSIRAFYIFYNYEYLKSSGWEQIFFGFALGLRFDLVILFQINFLFFIFWFFLLDQQKSILYRFFVQPLFILINTFFIALNMVDVELIRFHSRRLTPIFFTLKDDVGSQLPQLALYYWWIVICISALVYLLILAMRQMNIVLVDKIELRNPYSRSVSIFFFFLFAFYGVRQNWTASALNESIAFRQASEIGHMTLNTPFTFLRWRPEEVRTVFYLEDSKMHKWLQEAHKVDRRNIVLTTASPKNVLLLILESFSLEYMGEFVNGRPGYTPFLDELAQKSLFFKNGFANGKRSIEAVPSVLSAFPSLLDEPFMQSTAQNIQLWSLPRILNDKGFDSSFFHGAHNGSMFFDIFAAHIGIQNYYGLNEYPDKQRDSDGSWGILDEPYLQYVIKTLNSKRVQKPSTPFLATVFTLSSHQPYPVPAHLKGQFPKGSLPIHESIGYTDYALRKFFEEARKQDWFKETLFVITADHTQLIDDPRYQNILGRYRVPILFYKHNETWQGIDRDQIVQHADIPVSILSALGFESSEKLFIGRNFLTSSGKGFVVNRDSKGFWLYNGECFIWLKSDGELQAQVTLGEFQSKDLGLTRDTLQAFHEDHCKKSAGSLLKAYIQNFMNKVASGSMLF